MENYSDFDVNVDHKIVHEKLFEAYEQNGIEIPINERLAGDMLIVQFYNGDFFPGVYAGNGNFIASFIDWGVRTLNLDKYRFKIVKVRRMI